MAYTREVQWVPKTRLGKMVSAGQIKTIEEAFDTGLPIKEPEIIDALLPDLVDEVLDISMVQRMTDSGRRVKFRTTVVVGNGNGYVGIAEGKDVQVGPAIRKAIEMAKLNIVKIKRGCGSWECGCGLEHTVPCQVQGKAGSLTIVAHAGPEGTRHSCWRTRKESDGNGRHQGCLDQDRGRIPYDHQLFAGDL